MGLYLFGPLAVFSVVAYATFLACFYRASRRAVRPDGTPVSPAHAPDESPPGALPPVTVLKPCAGLEDGLEACLESYCRLDYPRYQVVFGVRDERDEALPVIRRVIARHPALDVAIAVGTLGHASPKVDNLAVCASRARYPLYWASDSNTRAHPGSLGGLVRDLRASGAALVVSPVVGVGEQTAGSALETLHLCAFVAMAGLATWRAIGRVAAAGKSCLLPRETLERVGGWAAIGRYHGDDVMLLKLARRAGLRPVLGRDLLANVSRRATVASFLARHTRWAQIRVRTVTPAALGEPLMYPFAAPVAFALAHPGAASYALLGLGLALQALGDAWVVRRVRGPGGGLSWRFAWALWARPALLLVMWARALFDRRTRWRGRASYVGPGSLVVVPRADADGDAEISLTRPARTLRGPRWSR